jgi:hypothetical protein
MLGASKAGLLGASGGALFKITALLVGGGGGGGTSASGVGGAGGGAGGVLDVALTPLESGSYSVVVGAGGGSYTNGSDSSFNGETAVGGGRGARGGAIGPAGSGGSGGSGAYRGGGINNAAGLGTAGQGNDGRSASGDRSISGWFRCRCSR